MSGQQREDYESIDRASQTLYERGWRSRFSLNGMMDAWRGLVEVIEAGYSEMFDEYTNDACCRKWLDGARPLLTRAVRAVRQPELDALDDRVPGSHRGGLRPTDEGGRLVVAASTDPSRR
jgi:hypothetical protein